MKKGLLALLAVSLLAGAAWLLFHRQIKRWIRPAKPVSTGRFQDPEGLAIDPAGRIYVSDEDRGTLTVLDRDGKTLLQVSELAGLRPFHGDSLVAESASRVVSIGEHEIRVLDLSGTEPKLLATWSKRGRAPGEFEDPEGIARDPANGDWYLTDEDNRRIQVFDKDGTFLRAFPVPNDPEGLWVTADGRVVVTFSKDHYVQAYSKDGTPGSRLGKRGSGLGEFDNPDYVRQDRDGNFWVTDQKNGRIVVLDKDLKPLRSVGRPGAGPGEFNDPEDLAFDAEGNLWVADGGNNRLQVLKPDGTFVREVR